MSQIRIYTTATGNCIAGDRREYSESEAQRVESDFRTGVRFAVDERHGEIRGFIPAYRGTEEGLCALLSVKNDPVDTAVFVKRVRGLFEQIDNWSIRTDTPEGRLLETLTTPVVAKEQPPISVDPIRDSRRLRVGEQSLEAAGQLLRMVRQRLDNNTDRLYVISHIKSPEHLAPNLLLHVSRSYNKTTVLTKE